MRAEDARLIWESWRNVGCSHVPFRSKSKCCAMTQSFETELEKVFGNAWSTICQKLFGD